MEVLIIADDFTGALDTGVQFAKRGIETQIIADQELTKEQVSPTAQVIVVDSETRALMPQEAYSKVKKIVANTIEFGVKTIFKKTDSALRGNVGAELEAVLEAVGQNEIYFIPAYPDLDRVTRNGVHYIEGKLLAESIFADDPFEPVVYSEISELLHSQSECRVEIITKDEPFLPAVDAQKTVYVFDAQSDQDIRSRTEELKQTGKLHLIAGCAGFAAHLPEALGLMKGKTQMVKRTPGLYIACGSLNPITKAQIRAAAAHHYPRVTLTSEQKLYRPYYQSEAGEAFLVKLKEIVKANRVVVVDTFDQPGQETTLDYAQSHDLTKEEVRYAISSCHGEIISGLLKEGLDYSILLTGGDTLMGVMKVLDGAQLHPVCEIDRGVVVSNLIWNRRSIQVITKSGGFGHREIINEIARKIVEEE